jgi:hypothetical protein
VMTILILFHTSGFRNLKTFYLHYTSRGQKVRFFKKLKA